MAKVALEGPGPSRTTVGEAPALSMSLILLPLKSWSRMRGGVADEAQLNFRDSHPSRLGGRTVTHGIPASGKGPSDSLPAAEHLAPVGPNSGPFLKP